MTGSWGTLLFLGALLDLGVDFHDLEHDLKRLSLDEYHLHISKQQRAHIAGTKFDVHLEEDHHHDESEHDGHERRENDHLGRPPDSQQVPVSDQQGVANERQSPSPGFW